MRVLLVTGKGGVGKSTTAVATALHAARGGLKTLVISTDPAHSIADVLGVPVGPRPTEVAPGLYAEHVDTQSAFERQWREVAHWLRALLDQAGVRGVEAEELTVLPGAEEVLALVELRRQVEGGDFDVVVVDCAPTGETLRLLALPEALHWWIDRVFSPDRRMMRTVRPLLGQLAGIPLPPDQVFVAAQRLAEELSGVRELLTDATRSSVRLVLTPESVPLAESRRTATTLALHGYRLDGVVASRVFPEAAAPDVRGDADTADGTSWLQGWVAAQRRRLAEIEESFPDVPVWHSPYAAAEPVGLVALTELAEATYGGDDPLALRATPDPLAVEQVTAEEFVLVLALPHAERHDVDLSRSGDDLVVTVGAARRVIALPSVLRRCLVEGAALRDGALRVRFTADPAQWRQL